MVIKWINYIVPVFAGKVVEQGSRDATFSSKPRIGEDIPETTREIQQMEANRDLLAEKRRLFDEATPDFYAPASCRTLILISGLVEYIPKSRRGY